MPLKCHRFKMSLISTKVILHFRTPGKRKGTFHVPGYYHWGVHFTSVFVLMELRVYLHLVHSGKWLYAQAHGTSYPGGMCLPYYSSSVVKVSCVLFMLHYLIRMFTLNYCNFLYSIKRNHVCILSYIPIKICHDEAVLFLS